MGLFIQVIKKTDLGSNGIQDQKQQQAWEIQSELGNNVPNFRGHARFCRKPRLITRLRWERPLADHFIVNFTSGQLKYKNQGVNN